MEETIFEILPRYCPIDRVGTLTNTAEKMIRIAIIKFP